MNATRKSIVMLTVALAVLFALSSVVLAHGYGRGGGGYYAGQGFRGQGLGGPGLGTLMGLNLSDAQRDQALKIMETYQIDRIKARGDMIKEHENLREALRGDTFDEKKVRQAYKKIASLREDQLVARAKVMNEMKAILTPEQVKLLDERTEAVSDWKETRRGYGRPFAGKWSGGCPRW